ncbi:hypothetical protein ACHAXM_010341 [Skeletonema potamos]
MRVIPSALLLSIGSVFAQDGADTPALISTTSSLGTDAGGDPVPTLISIDPDDPPIPELFDDTDTDLAVPSLFGGAGDDDGADMFGDLGDLMSGIFGGDGSGGDAQDMFGDLNDMLSGIFGGSDANADGQASFLENFLGDGSSSSGSIDLECPSSCGKPDLCKVDLMSLMMGGMDTLQEMCDNGCIPSLVLDACDTNAVPDTAAVADGTTTFIASTGVCDFVNCCVAKEQEETGDATVVVSPTRTKFDECQAKLPEMADLFASTTFPQDLATGTSDIGDFGDMFNMTGIQDMLGELVDGFEEILNQFGNGMLSDMFADMFDSSSIPAFCAIDTCVNAPAGFCECFGGDLAQCNKDVISQACTSDSFSTCAPDGFTDFCSRECGQSSGADLLHMCAMCNVVTCCSKDNSEIEGCLSEALAVDHSQVVIDDAAFSELEDLLGGIDLEGMLTEILGNMESMKWCPDDKTCPEPLGQQFCDIANGGPSATESDTAVSPRSMDLQSFDMESMMGMDLDKMCSSDILLSCGPVDMKEKCDSVCGTDDTGGIMKETFCRLCAVATCCEGGDKTFSECSSVSYIPAGSTSNQSSGEINEDSSTSTPDEVINETNTASDEVLEADITEAAGSEASDENEAEELDPAQVVALENGRLEMENSGMTFSPVTFFTATISIGLMLALH